MKELRASARGGSLQVLFMFDPRRQIIFLRQNGNEWNMPSTKNYKELRGQVIARPGAAERLAALRQQTLAEIGLYEMRRYLDWSQSGLATELGITQAAVSQLENAQDLTVSRLRKYLQPLGARLQILAVFKNEGEEYRIPIRVGRKAS